MKVFVANKRVTLTDTDLLGVGGEARVYRWGAHAIKIFHPVDASLDAGARCAAEAVLEAKLQKVRAFPRGLPEEVVSPLEIVSDAQGAPIGYLMHAIEGAKEVLYLGRRNFREGVVSNDEVTALMRRLLEVIDRVHASGVVVGDLNDGNVLFDGTRPWVIDADSMQFDGHPTVVAHERFLDPRLFGRDLTKGVVLDRETDWYAFAVLLFSSLLYVHPYGGTHLEHPTLLRRAEASYSVLRSDVRYPKAAQHFRILPDDLLAYFEQVFDRGARGRFPETLLRIAWTRCACGLEHARYVCPDCASKGVVVTRPAVRHSGTCRAVRILKTRGRVIAALVQGNLKYLYEEDGIVRREDGSVVMEERPDASMRFAISGSVTWIGRKGEVVAIERGSVKTRRTTEMIEGVPSFDANSEGAFLIENEWLVDEGRCARVGKILEGQTWFRVGATLGFGFYRAGLTTFYFLFRPGRPGVLDVRLPPIDGRLVDANAVFDDDHVLLSLLEEKQGALTAKLFLIGRDGIVKARLAGSPESARALSSTRGKCVLGGRMLTATDDGLLSLAVDPNASLIVEGTLFADTEPFVSSGTDILPGPQGSVYAVTSQEITQLVLA